MVRLPVRLESREPTRRRFLRDCDVVVEDGRYAPIEYEGHRFVFSHRTLLGGYHQDVEDEALVFVEEEP